VGDYWRKKGMRRFEVEKLLRRIQGTVFLLAAPKRKRAGIPGSETREYDCLRV
jgi:hypothetical protein